MDWPRRLRTSESGTPDVAQGGRRRTLGLYLLLVVLPLLVLVPLLAYSGALLYLMSAQAREASRQELVSANRAMGAVIQREMDQTLEILDLVSRSPAMTREDVDTEVMSQLLADVTRSRFGIRAITLIDTEGWVKAEYPIRGPARRIPDLSPTLRQALETGEPAISPLHQSRLDGSLVITVVQPVQRFGHVPWLLSARIDTAHIARLMQSQLAGRDAVATLMDPQLRIIARTRDMDRWFGHLPSPQTQDALASGPSGTRRFYTLDSNEYMWAWSRTPGGWSVMLGVPALSIDRVFWQSMASLGAVGVLVLLVAVGVTVLVARRIVRSVDRMAANAPRLVRGETPPYQGSGIRQLDALYEALVQASEQVMRALAVRDQALESERAARKAADEDNRAKDMFIATLSHELRNPLAPVRSAARLLKLQGATEKARAWAADVIERQVAAMAQLLEDLLDLSRVRGGRVVLDRQAVSLRSVMDTALETAQPLIDSHGHTVVDDLPREEILLDADPLRVGQVFANLLTNAAKYTDSGGRIVLSGERADGLVLVHVQDNGIGLAPDELETIFHPFTQVGGRERTRTGLGIGLSLVRGLVEVHGGWVRAHSDGPGQGSCFTVALPLAQS